jgi:hypothetical protein
MGLIERNQLIGKISPPFDNLLATQLVDEFISMERRYIQRDWEPANLDGGQFAEIAARILYHLDTGNISHRKEFRDCTRYLENNDVPHKISNRKEVSHFVHTLQTVYKFRSERGAIHISDTYSPNHMDSKFLIESVRWIFNEFLRVYWNGDREEVARVIHELLQFDVPCIGVFGNRILVQRTDLKTEEELLVLLHYAGERGFSRNDIGKYSMCPAPKITLALQKLMSSAYREILKLGTGNYVLTDLGHRRIRNQLTDKLLVQ